MRILPHPDETKKRPAGIGMAMCVVWQAACESIEAVRRPDGSVDLVCDGQVVATGKKDASP